jgi:hypothetical protein
MSQQTSTDNLLGVYQANCTRYENIIQHRFTLLTLVPAATAASFAVPLFANPTKNLALQNMEFPFGMAGTLLLVGLFMIALINFRDGENIHDRLQAMETILSAHWPLEARQHSTRSQRYAACIIFSVSLGGWACVAFWFVLVGTAIFLALAVVVASFFILYLILLRI